LRKSSIKAGLSELTISWPLIWWKSTLFLAQKQGREGLKQVISLARLVPPFPTSIGVIEEMLGEGEKVFSRFTWHGTQRSEFFGVPATGKQITVKGVVVDHVAGKMVESQILVVVKGFGA